MDDLHNEIRAAFEREQAAYPPAGNLRPKFERAARNFQWLAVAAAVVLTALVVVGLVSSRLTNRGTVSPPKATPSPVGDYGPPPAGVPLFYVADPNHLGWYIGFDWSGKPRGTVKPSQAIDPNANLLQAPDGQAFMINQSGKGGAGQFLDRLGTPASSLNSGTYGLWADDSRHFCAIAYDPSQISWTLVLAGVNQAPRNVALIARDTSVGQTGIGLLSCSIANDQAIAVRTVISYPSELWVIQLSTGKTLFHRTFSNAASLSYAVASADGKLLAENSISAVGQAGTGPSTRVVTVSGDRVVATLSPSTGVLAFSADDAYALVTTSPWDAAQPVKLAVVELVTGKTVWQSGGTHRLAGYAVEPASAGFAIMFTDNDPNALAHPAVSIVMVYGSGKTTAIPGTYLRP